MLCYDFKHAVVEVFGDLEHAGEVVAEFGYDELFGVVFFILPRISAIMGASMCRETR